MKTFLTLPLLLIGILSYSQSLPIDFETAVTTSSFVDFDGGMASVIPNPQSNAANPSAKVAQIVRNGGQIWAGSKLTLSNNLDFTIKNTISMMVYTTAPIGTDIKLKLESTTGTIERDKPTTKSGAWETITFDFTGAPNNFITMAFMFDFGNTGNGTPSSTFLFDNVNQYSAGTQINLPVSFEDNSVNYTMFDFGGNKSELIEDPANSTNHVVKVTKPIDAATWAGTTVGTPAGFVSNIPLTNTNSKMTMKVWSPNAGVPIRLKVEDAKDPTHTCETQTLTTKVGQWEDILFDFSTEAPGTAKLSFGLSNGWIYNMASVFFNFGTDGATAGEKVYYFDNLTFGDTPLDVYYPETENWTLYPNPSDNQCIISTDQQAIQSVLVYDVYGKLILSERPYTKNFTLPILNLSPGHYNVLVKTAKASRNFKLIRK